MFKKFAFVAFALMLGLSSAAAYAGENSGNDCSSCGSGVSTNHGK